MSLLKDKDITGIPKDSTITTKQLDALEWALTFMRNYERKNKRDIREVHREGSSGV